MRSFLVFSFVLVGLAAGSFSASAQRTTAPAANRPGTFSQLAMATTAEAVPTVSAPAMQLACSQLDGLVLGLDGKPLTGATVTVKGTQHLYITNSEGRYLVEVPVYQGQLLEVEAAGYTTREVSLNDCSVQPVALELADGTRIKKRGKRAGQIVRFGTADMQ